ncbi:MAG: hypothetical protein AAF596_01805 [Planctomycetota bacterium]
MPTSTTKPLISAALVLTLTTGGPALAGDPEPPQVIDATIGTTASDSFELSSPASDLGQFAGFDESIAASVQSPVDFPEDGEPVMVPEPSAFAMLAALAGLLLAMTLLRWHFDRTTAAQVATAKVTTNRVA